MSIPNPKTNQLVKSMRFFRKTIRRVIRFINEQDIREMYDELSLKSWKKGQRIKSLEKNLVKAKIANRKYHGQVRELQEEIAMLKAQIVDLQKKNP